MKRLYHPIPSPYCNRRTQIENCSPATAIQIQKKAGAGNFDHAALVRSMTSKDGNNNAFHRLHEQTHKPFCNWRQGRNTCPFGRSALLSDRCKGHSRTVLTPEALRLLCWDARQE